MKNKFNIVQLCIIVSISGMLSSSDMESVLEVGRDNQMLSAKSQDRIDTTERQTDKIINEYIEYHNLDDCDWPGVYAFKCKASGLVKLGMSSKSVKERVRGQLCGLPLGGVFIGAKMSKNPSGDERKLHKRFDFVRSHPRKEWFSADAYSVLDYMNEKGA